MNYPIVLLLGLMPSSVSSFNGVIGPFEKGERVPLFVNSLYSDHTLLTKDIETHAGFCFAPNATVPKLNFGQTLQGDRYVEAPFALELGIDAYCQQLCVTNLDANHLRDLISQSYHVRWMLGDLPSAIIWENDLQIVTRYSGGSALGYYQKERVDKNGKVIWQGMGGSDFSSMSSDRDSKDEEGNNIMMYFNHFNFKVYYEELSDGKYGVARFLVEPFSIKRNFSSQVPATIESETNHTWKELWKDPETGESLHFPRSSIASCTDRASFHTDYNLIHARGNDGPQEANGLTMITYDVEWRNATEQWTGGFYWRDPDQGGFSSWGEVLSWRTRWTVYLTMDDAVPSRVFRLPMIWNSAVVVILGAITGSILHSNRRKQVQDAESGWRILSGDVFRPPSSWLALFCGLCGFGAQLTVVGFVLSVLGLFRVVSGANRGSECTTMLWVYISTGWIFGFVTTWLDHSLRGHRKMWKKIAVVTALVLPGIAYVLYVLINVGYSNADSTMAMPGSVLAQLAGYWFGILSPLTFAGAFAGSLYRRINLPVDKSNPPATIPVQPLYQRYIPLGFVIGGATVHLATYVHSYFILSSFVGTTFFEHYGSLLVSLVLSAILCGLIASLACFVQLRRENHRWWWRSFFVPGGGAAIGIIISSIVLPDFGPSLQQHAPTVVLAAYYGGMLAIACGVLCINGFIGVMCTLLFNKLLYAFVKEKAEEELSDSHVSMVEMRSGAMLEDFDEGFETSAPREGDVLEVSKGEIT